MPKYYNKLRSPLPLQLPSGSTVVKPKSFIDISRSDEGCSSVVRYVKKGFLVPPRTRPSQETKSEVNKKTPKPELKVEADVVKAKEIAEIKEQNEEEENSNSNHDKSLSLDPPTESAQLSSEFEKSEAKDSPKPRKKSRKSRRGGNQ